MKAENEKSFLRYYHRILNLHQKWIAYIVSMLACFGKEVSWQRKPAAASGSIKERCDYFLSVSHTYCREIGKLNSDENLVLYGDFEMQYILSLLGSNQMGLGP